MFNGTVSKLCEWFYFNVPYHLKTYSFISDSFKMFTKNKKKPAPSFSSHTRETTKITKGVHFN